MTGFQLPLIQSYRPRSFRERGLVGPFTTPTLAGARLRRVPNFAACASARPALSTAPAERLRASSLEVVVPNPSGGRGVYILPWGDIGGLCRPTMHDVVLGRTLSTMLDASDAQLSPMMVRDAARQTASQGLAGRAAAHAADKATESQAEGLMATRFTLLMEVTEQMEARHPTAAPPSRLVEASPAEIEQRGRAALTRLAQELGQPPQVMADLLDVLASQYVDVGIGLGMAEATLARVVARLGELHHDLVGWAQSESSLGTEHARSDSRDAVAVAAAGELASRMARLLLDSARGRLADMPGLMAACLTAPTETADLCDRPGWLLDGWEPICTLWHAAPGLLPRHTALQEMARQVPVLPDEAEAWLGLPAGLGEQLFLRPPVSHAPSRDGTSALDRVARNERLRAMAG